MAALKLTDDETVLARSTEDGQVCVLPVSASATSPSHIIRAEALKRLVLGLPVILADEIAPREVHIKAPGLRVCNARIEGALELNDATGPNGEPLPPLVLMRCFLNEPIAMSRARFRHLSFEGSRLTHLCAMDLKIEGTLDLSDVSSAQTGVTDGMMGEGQCWIELCGARIAGELRACRSRFVAGMETRAHEDMLKEPRYALNLRNGQIADGIDLYPDVTAIGGISLYLADIGGDIAAYGAELIGENAWLAKEDAKETDRHGAALDLRSARIRGLALFQPYTTHGKDTKPFSARGNLRLAGCEINGDLRLDGATIFGSVLGQDMVVKGDFYVQNFRGSKNGQRHDYCPDITGALNLHSADIGKALSLCSLTLTGTFNGNQLQVGGNLFMNARKGLDSDQAKLLPFKIGGDVFLQAATIAGHIQAYGVHFAGDVHAQRSIVGDGLFLCCLEGENECLRFRADKDLDFSLCRTSGQVVVSGAKIDGSLALSRSSAGFVGIIPHQRTHGGKTEQVQTEIGGGIELANAKIAGDVGFAGTKISGGVDLNDINIDGNLNFSPVPSDGPDGLQSLLVEFGSDVSLYGAKISGRLAVSGLICLGEFSAHSLSIGGTIFFNAANGHDKGKPKLLRNEVTGIAQFRSATIGGQFQAEGAWFKGGLNAANATVGGHLLFTPSKLDPAENASDVPCQIGDNLYLANAKFKADVKLSGAVLEKGANLSDCEIEGDLVIQGIKRYLNGKDHTFIFTCADDFIAFGLKLRGQLLATGASIGGAFVLDNGKFEGDVHLNSYAGGRLDGKEHNFPFSVKGVFSAVDALVRLNFRLTSARLEGGLEAARLHVDGDLDLDKLTLANTLNLKQAAVRGRMKLSFKRMKEVSGKEPLIPLDLRNARVGEYDDFDGEGLRGRVKMDIEGFHFERLATKYDQPQSSSKASGLDMARLMRTRLPEQAPWILGAAWLCGALVYKLFALPYADHAMVAAFISLGVVGLISLLTQNEPDSAPWRVRARWLRSQFQTWPPHPAEYKPGPYERLALYFRSEGLYKEARKITSLRLTTERELKLFWLFRPVIWLYGVFFDYGLSPTRALLTFGACVLIGACGADIASGGKAIAPRFEAAAAVVDRMSGVKWAWAPAPAPALLSLDAKQSCAAQIDPPIYALDVFLPAIDMHQESACVLSAAPEAWPWRYAKAAFTILGWLVTSLTVLTVSGILRRQAGA